MERPSNPIRQALASRGYAAGSVMHSWSPNVMEAAGYSGLDFMRIDTEHTWRQDSSLEHLIRAAYVTGIAPIVRVDRDNPALVRKALEVGAQAIIVPDIHSPQDAEAIVSAAKFPPLGRRGYSGNCWSAGWGTKAGSEWIEWSDKEPMIGAMIENQEAMGCIDQILATDGLDFVLFGPADFAMSLGWRRTAKDSDEIQDALRRTIKAARQAGKHVMLGVPTQPDELRHYRELGVTMLEFSNDLKILGDVWRKAGQALKETPR
jgi:4-hydroxy-2-oxoheptanedioate aldolase